MGSSSKKQQAIIALKNHAAILELVQTELLSSEAELLLIKRGRSDEIVPYLNCRMPSLKAQVALVERGKKRELETLFSKYPLFEEAQVALLNKGKREDVLLYLSYRSFTGKAVLVMRKRYSLAERVAFAKVKNAKVKGSSVLKK